MQVIMSFSFTRISFFREKDKEPMSFNSIDTLKYERNIGITPETTIHAFLNNMYYIGNLVEEDDDKRWHLNPEAYLRLLKSCYYERYGKQISCFVRDIQHARVSPAIEDRKRKPSKKSITNDRLYRTFGRYIPDTIDGEDWWHTIDWIVFVKVIRDRNTRTKMHVPKTNEIWWNFLRLALSLKIINYSHTTDGHTINEVTLQHGESIHLISSRMEKRSIYYL